MNQTNTVSTIEPVVGMGATINFHSDSKAATLVQVSHKGSKIVLQQDKATRTDQNGVSESQSYSYEADPNGAIYIATLRSDGRYRLVGSGKKGKAISLGVRREYYDYSF
jgi:hypothetical protein